MLNRYYESFAATEGSGLGAVTDALVADDIQTVVSQTDGLAGRAQIGPRVQASVLAAAFMRCGAYGALRSQLVPLEGQAEHGLYRATLSVAEGQLKEGIAGLQAATQVGGSIAREAWLALARVAPDVAEDALSQARLLGASAARVAGIQLGLAIDRAAYSDAEALLSMLDDATRQSPWVAFGAVRHETLVAPKLTTYQSLKDLKARLGELGHAGLLAHTHLLMAQVSPRVDFRVTHVEHAGSLFEALGDARSHTLAAAWEAQVEAELGELEGAEDLALQAREAAAAAGNREAEALATLVQAVCLRALERPEEAKPHFDSALALSTVHQLIPIRLHTLSELGRDAEVRAEAKQYGLMDEGWGLL